MAATGSCPLCGQPLGPGSTLCENCGAKIPAPTPPPPPRPPPNEEILLEQLEDLKDTVAEEGMAEQLETLEKAADATADAAVQTIGELAAVEEGLSQEEDRLVEEEADLTEFIRRVEERVTRQAHEPAPPPRRSAAGASLLAAGGLLVATGLFLLPDTILVGAFTFLAGVAIVAIGFAVRFGPHRQK